MERYRGRERGEGKSERNGKRERGEGKSERNGKRQRERERGEGKSERNGKRQRERERGEGKSERNGKRQRERERGEGKSERNGKRQRERERGEGKSERNGEREGEGGKRTREGKRTVTGCLGQEKVLFHPPDAGVVLCGGPPQGVMGVGVRRSEGRSERRMKEEVERDVRWHEGRSAGQKGWTKTKKHGEKERRLGYFLSC